MRTLSDVFPENQNLSIKTEVIIHACMVQAGFQYKMKGVSWCYTFKEENLSNCRLDAVIS
ncbi:hypothetical protein O9A_00886 [Bartonella koehlerae C-29]|uniref:Uncharacterized protein n=1 Tax=Bartonella koehlerae C-29 TaxID=1134510 RepID=A0A067W840_9HYPH|nr:hypothetical protein O9A_00886 [Bartonella koehlerae C-29]